MNDIIKLKIIPPVLFKTIEQNINGILIKYNKKKYIVTLHHFLPIDKVIDNNDNILEIYNNSNWSAVLILLSNDNHINKIHNKFNNNLSKLNNVILNSVEYKIESIVFKSINNFKNNPELPYITIKSDDNNNIGYPVYNKDRLVGIVSHYSISEKLIYILPIFIIIKNILKKDNNFYHIDYPLKKINSYCVKNDFIYYPIFKIKIPISTYYLLEGEDNKDFNIQYIKNNIIINDTIKLFINNNLYIPHDTDLIYNENKYKINIRLIMLLKYINIDKNILFHIFNCIEKNKDNKDLWISLKSR